jgi:hypothetical protein
MRVLLREEELTTENRMLVLDGGKIDRSAEALLNQTVLPLSLYRSSKRLLELAIRHPGRW